MRIKKGDKVKVLLGKDRGKEGTIEYLMAKKGKVFVGGANIYKRHVKKREGIEGGIIDIPKPIDISNVALICPNCKRITRVGFKLIGKENRSSLLRKVRICKKCRKEIV